MLHQIPDSLRAESPHYHALIKHASTPEQSAGATLVTFSGMSRPQLKSAALKFASAAGKPALEIDLSRVVSKYIGETEKNLDQLFQRAQASNAILLFDEGDALFGERTGVKDSHDRYGGLTPDALMQKIARYRGTVIVLEPQPRPRRISPHRIRQLAVHFPP